jgi:predicted lipid-binding transport protein (Tim44 family)
MGGEFQFIDIILFALVAAFLILRLRNVLGRRDGHQQPQSHDPFKPADVKSPDGRERPERPTNRDHSDDKVIQLPDRGERPAEAREPVVEEGAGPVEPGPLEAGPLEAGLAQIRTADPQFNEDEFLSGARMAFEMILGAFSAGDTGALKPLLSPEVFGNFAQSIREREQAGETMELNVVDIRAAEIVEAYMAGRTAHLTVKFISEQIGIVRDEKGEIVEGDPQQSTEATDFWTFARDTRSPNPNWTLVATGAPD